ncbi:exosome complex protein Rrp42 [Methanosphaera sp. WGK6]|uniref:exosome complex protein Rrp42 n=1 Tax=Methanosphaera sp. WGK6 TaxID=1561964 RepID=UPI0009FDE194|nr:exosome complex protein Rrp42 [Methanosphaera sp. WGK6]
MVNIISEISKEKIFDLLNQGTRIDNRKFTEYRPISIKTDYIGKADGSAMVSIGNTTVVAGIKAQLTTPFNNTPDKGIIITNTELLVLASRNFEYGPPNKFAVEISRVVDRAIRESPLIDLEQLCIVEGSKVWKLHIDIDIIDFDGNIMDAACLGAVAALLTTKIPTATSVNDELTIDEDNLTKLPIKNKSILCTIVKINDKLIVDPMSAEESLMDSSISIGFREDGSLCAIQKCGLNTMTLQEVMKTMTIARARSKQLFSIINKIK